MFKDIIDEWTRKERGSLPTPIECTIIIWVFAIMWKEIKVRWRRIEFFEFLLILYSFCSVARKLIFSNLIKFVGSVRNRPSWICPRFVELGRHLHQYLFRRLDCAPNHCLHYRETWGGFGYQSLYQKRALERLRPLPDFGGFIWSWNDFQLLETSPYFLNQPTLRTSTSEFFYT